MLQRPPDEAFRPGRSSGPSRWSPTLDALRAIAITLVVLRHGVSVPGLAASDVASAPLYNLMANGWLGVDLFFVLSGYLLSTQILRSLANQRYSASNFVARRALRTLPAYLTVLIALWMGVLASTLTTKGAGDPTALLAHLLFLNDYFGPPILVTFWSLATEEKFYLLMALLVPALFLCSKQTACALLAAMIGAVMLARTGAFLADPPHIYTDYFWQFRAPFHFAVDGLLIGVLGGFAWHYGWRLVKLPRYGLLFIFACAALFLTTTEWAADEALGHALIAAPAFSCLTLLGIYLHPQVDHHIAGGWFAKAVGQLARISYSLYLTHYIAAKLAVQWLRPLTADTAGQVTYWTVYLGLSLVLGSALFRLAELPGLHLRERLAKPAGAAPRTVVPREDTFSEQPLPDPRAADRTQALQAGRNRAD